MNPVFLRSITGSGPVPLVQTSSLDSSEKGHLAGGERGGQGPRCVLYGWCLLLLLLILLLCCYRVALFFCASRRSQVSGTAPSCCCVDFACNAQVFIIRTHVVNVLVAVYTHPGMQFSLLCYKNSMMRSPSSAAPTQPMILTAVRRTPRT